MAATGRFLAADEDGGEVGSKRNMERASATTLDIFFPKNSFDDAGGPATFLPL
jgi:hypothetical protein